MKLDWLKIVKSGLKVVAAVLGGVAVYCGIEKLTKKKVTENDSTCDGDSPLRCKSFSDLGPGRSTSPEGKKIVKNSERFISVMKVAQAVCSSASEVSKGVISVASNFARVFDPEPYKNSLPTVKFQGEDYPSGNYAWDPSANLHYGDVSRIENGGSCEYWGRG